jgi:hypothetical protein
MKVDYLQTKAQDISDHGLELLLVELNDAEVACITMRSNANTNRGSPTDETDNSLLRLAPILLDEDKEVLESIDLDARLGKLGLILAQLIQRFGDVDSVLDLASECLNLPFKALYRVDIHADQGLDGRQVLLKCRSAHDHDLLLGRRIWPRNKVRKFLDFSRLQNLKHTVVIIFQVISVKRKEVVTCSNGIKLISNSEVRTQSTLPLHLTTRDRKTKGNRDIVNDFLESATLLNRGEKGWTMT